MQASASVTASGDSKAAIGEALKQALSGNRLQSISLHDERGDVLWLDEGALGPDEHNLVLEAVSALNAAPDRNLHFQSIGDGRSAAFLPARSPLNDLLGIAMIIADAKFLDSKGAAKFVTPTTTNLMRRLAFLRQPAAARASPTPPPAPPAAVAGGSSARPGRAAPPQPPQPPARQPRGASRPARPRLRPRAASRAPAAQRPARPPSARGACRPGRPGETRRPAAKGRATRTPRRPAAPRRAPGRTRRQTCSSAASGSADSDSIAFEISDIDPKALLKPPGSAGAGRAGAKRPDLRVVQTDRLPKLELPARPDPIPELIQDDSPSPTCRRSTHDEVVAEEDTTEVEALRRRRQQHERRAGVRRRDPAPAGAGPGQFEFYGQVYELHVQQLVKLKGSGGTTPLRSAGARRARRQ